MFSQGLLLFLPVLVYGLPDLRGRASGVTTDPSTASGKTFDYIIVGGGLGGFAVAGRLSEDLSKTILLIEAGNDERTNPAIFDLYEYGVAINDTELSWHWPTDQGRTMIGFVVPFS